MSLLIYRISIIKTDRVLAWAEVLARGAVVANRRRSQRSRAQDEQKLKPRLSFSEWEALGMNVKRAWLIAPSFGLADPKGRKVVRGADLSVAVRTLGRVAAFASAAAAGLAAPILLGVIWFWGARQGLIPDQILPPPDVVWQTLRENFADGTLQNAALVSLQRVLAGFITGAIGGALVGGALGGSKTLRAFIEPFFLAFNQVPHIAWLPVLILLVGIGEPLKIILIGWAAFLPVMLCTAQGVRDVPAAYRELGRVLVFDKRTVLTTIILPSALPSIFTGVREGLANAWHALVAAELLASFEGLGYLMAYGRQLFQLELVMAAIAVIGLIGLVFYGLLTLVEIRLRRWRLEVAR
jgi:sulfonate transport system permease protein